MLINDVCSLTGLTKKAIGYYEKQGLLNPRKGMNGYREYSENDVVVLNEISLYRKLDISIKDIKSIINSDDKKIMLNKIMKDKYKKEIQLKMQKSYLERIINDNFDENSIRQLNEEIINIEKSSGEFISRELIRCFPSGIGRYLANHFKPYLNEPLDTADKCRAWIEIVDFLDNIPEIKIPKIIEMGYENISDDMNIQLNENMRNEMNKMFDAKGEELEEYKKKLLNNIEQLNDKSLLKIMNPFYKFKKQMNEFFHSSGYYDIFLPNIKIISSDYKEYHDKLTAFNKRLCEELEIEYDENMRVIKTNK